MSGTEDYAPDSVRRRASLHPKTVSGARFHVDVPRRAPRRTLATTTRVVKVDPRVWATALRLVEELGLTASHIEIVGAEEVVVRNHPAR